MNNDHIIIRELAKKWAEASAKPSNQEKIGLWKSLNGLKMKRPMVSIDQLPWNELNVNDELTLKCEDRVLRNLENSMRMQLYQNKYFQADVVLPAAVEVPKRIRNWGFGVPVIENKLAGDVTNSVVSHKYFDQLADDEAVEKMTLPVLEVFPEDDKNRLEIAQEALGGIVPARLAGMVMHCGIWDYITFSRSVDAILYDIIDRPEHTHKIVQKYLKSAMSLVDQAEELGLFDVDAPYIHCTGAFTDELPAPGYDGKKARAKDVWCFGLAQVFAQISPAMFEEFEIDPVKQLLDRFGLVYYGCCDPLDRKIHIVRKLATVRKISVSPWASKTRSAEQMAGDFVFSAKPNPAFLAMDTFDEDLVRKDLQETVDICKQFGTPCELILKDVSTVKYQPERLARWERIAMEVVGGI